MGPAFVDESQVKLAGWHRKSGWYYYAGDYYSDCEHSSSYCFFDWVADSAVCCFLSICRFTLCIRGSVDLWCQTLPSNCSFFILIVLLKFVLNALFPQTFTLCSQFPICRFHQLIFILKIIMHFSSKNSLLRSLLVSTCTSTPLFHLACFINNKDSFPLNKSLLHPF